MLGGDPLSSFTLKKLPHFPSLLSLPMGDESLSSNLYQNTSYQIVYSSSRDSRRRPPTHHPLTCTEPLLPCTPLHPMAQSRLFVFCSRTACARVRANSTTCRKCKLGIFNCLLQPLQILFCTQSCTLRSLQYRGMEKEHVAA